jgi:hypothetical protein
MYPDDEESYQLLVIGYIPKDNRCEHIGTGDTSGSGTKEVNVRFFNGFAHSDTKNISFKLLERNGAETHYKETAKLWKDIAAYAEKKLTRGKLKLSPRHIARCFLHAQGEIYNVPPGVTNVAEPSDCGEFRNEDGRHSGKYFIKYEHFDGDDYLDENVYVIK